MTASTRRISVKIEKPGNAKALCLVTTSVVDKMTDNPWFPDAAPLLKKVRAAIATLDEWNTQALYRTKGSAARKTEARGALSVLLKQLESYVEVIANENPEHAHEIVASAGMVVVERTRGGAEPFAVDHLENSGGAKPHCKAGPKGSTYYWQMSGDGKKTWMQLEPTKQAHTTVSDLVPGKTYWFRHAILTRGGMGDWSEAIPFVAR